MTQIPAPRPFFVPKNRMPKYLDNYQRNGHELLPCCAITHIDHSISF